MTRQAKFTITLDRSPKTTVSVDYTTQPGTAVAGEDFTSVSGTVSFNAGETSKDVFVNVRDTDEDHLEQFTVELSNPVGLVIATASGVCRLPARALELSIGSGVLEDYTPAPQAVLLDNFVGARMALTAHTLDIGGPWQETAGTAAFQLDSVGLTSLDNIDGQSTISAAVEVQSAYTADVVFVVTDPAASGNFQLRLEDGTTHGLPTFTLTYTYGSSGQELSFGASDHYETIYASHDDSTLALAVGATHLLRLRVTPTFWEIDIDGVSWYNTAIPNNAPTPTLLANPSFVLSCTDSSNLNAASFRFDQVAVYPSDMGSGAEFVSTTPPAIPLPPSPAATALAALNPTTITSSASGVLADTMGQLSESYLDNNNAPQSNTSASNPVLLSDGSYVHYQVSWDPTHPEAPSSVWLQVAPPSMAALPSSAWVLDPVADAAWIAEYNARIPFAVQFLDAQGRLYSQAMFATKIVPDQGDGQYYLPGVSGEGPVNMLWTQSNIALVTQMGMTARLDQVRDVLLYPVQMYYDETNDNTTDPTTHNTDTGVFGEAGYATQNGYIYRQYYGGNKYDPNDVVHRFGENVVFFHAQVTGAVMYQLDTATGNVQLWLTTGDGMSYHQVDQSGDYAQGPNSQFEAWYNAALPLQCQILDIDDHVIGSGTFTETTAVLGSDVAPQLSIATSGWGAANLRYGWKMRFTEQASLG